MTPPTEVEVRADSIAHLRSVGIDPFGVAFDNTSSTKDARYQCEKLSERMELNIPLYDIPYRVAGRITSKRVMGKLSFIDIMDTEGKIQIVVSRDDLEDGFYNDVFKRHIQIGDVIGVDGIIYITERGENSVKANKVTLLGKSSRPIPFPKVTDDETFNEVGDPDYLQRHRYIDLLTNPVRLHTLRQRAEVIRALRNTLEEKDYTEVETPILQSQYGGASARPFTTKHHALDMDMYLRIAPELYLKRLMIGGFSGVFEIGKNFRNEGISRFHNPEFTMLELYVAYRDVEWMMIMVEELLDNAVLATDDTQMYAGLNASISRTGLVVQRDRFARVSYLETLDTYVPASDWIKNEQYDSVCEHARMLGVTDVGENMAELIDNAFSQFVEPSLTIPTFVTDFPTLLSPLAKQTVGNPDTTQRFELYIGGKEIANGFTELNDPVEQRLRFEQQQRDHGDGIDEDYIHALEHGLPYCVGLGIGIDRLVMAVTGSETIRDVIPFPTMRPNSNV